MNAVNRPSLEVDVDQQVATLWLNRPERRNALDDGMIRELSQALQRLSEDPGVRVLVLAGRGSAFCAGGDLNWLKRTADYSEYDNRRDALSLAGMLRSLSEFGKPTIARVHGAAYAGGMGLASACDILVASSDAEFCLSEVRVGLVPATIAPYVLRALGVQAARRYMLTAERLAAAEAHRLGFVHEICDPCAMDDIVFRLTRALLAGGPDALGKTKSLIRGVEKRMLDGALAAETAALIATVRASGEGREGVASFLEKRRPAWSSAMPARP